jgi:hypothetical protein
VTPRGRVAAVTELLARRSNPRDINAKREHGGEIALVLTARFGHRRMVQCLLGGGTSIDT